MLGLKRNTVILCPHEKAWEEEAERTIDRLRNVLGSCGKAYAHVGSTSIMNISAKPIIDIAVAVDELADIEPYYEAMLNAGFEHIPKNDDETQKFFSCGEGSFRTHYIHVVRLTSDEWANYNNFRDYCNGRPDVARDYENVKKKLAEKYPDDREKYTEGKAKFIKNALRHAKSWVLLGRTVTAEIEPPSESIYPKNGYTNQAEYGYVEGMKGFHGYAQECYILGAKKSKDKFTGVVIAVIYHHSDLLDVLVLAPKGKVYDQAQIAEAVYFRERFYNSDMEHLYHTSCGFIVYRMKENEPEFLLLYQSRSKTYSVPKGHREMGETEEETAQREAFEEVGIKVNRKGDFKASLQYRIEPIYKKTVTLFLAEYNGELNRNPDEIASYKWMRLEEIKPLVLPALYDALAKASLYIKNNK